MRKTGFSKKSSGVIFVRTKKAARLYGGAFSTSRVGAYPSAVAMRRSVVADPAGALGTIMYVYYSFVV